MIASKCSRYKEPEVNNVSCVLFDREGMMQISTLQRPGGRLGPGPTMLGTGFGSGGPGSINGSLGKPMTEDEMSLNDYASFNAGKFNEDGSFLGQYNPSLRRPGATEPYPQNDSLA
jgi:hypothetical protein